MSDSPTDPTAPVVIQRDQYFEIMAKLSILDEIKSAQKENSEKLSKLESIETSVHQAMARLTIMEHEI